MENKTLRDHFAGIYAKAALIDKKNLEAFAGQFPIETKSAEEIAKEAYRFADIMVKASKS